MIATQLYIRMADNEWSSNCPMDALAKEQLELHKDVPNLVVYVNEHAGWYLGYAMVDGRMVIVDTANDAATVSPERRRFWERVKGATWESLPGINRNDLTPACTA